MRHRLAVLALSALTACGGEPPSAERSECAGLLDRWVRLQQDHLDRLGDADLAELATGSGRTIAAERWLGGAMLEQIRDAEGLGCAEELAAGSSSLCRRLDDLQPRGEAGEAAVRSMQDRC